MRYSDEELRAIARTAKQVASCALTLRQAVNPADVRHWSRSTCFALWRFSLALAPARFSFNIWKHREFPAQLRPEWPDLGSLLTRIRWGAERIAPCVGIYQLAEYRPSKLDLVADEYVRGFVAEIRGLELADSIHDLRDAAGQLASWLKRPARADMTADRRKEISHRKPLISKFVVKAKRTHKKGGNLTRLAVDFAARYGGKSENYLRAFRRAMNRT
ncbi:MAG TPA: hypothetical protein VHC22_34000 [Pirellulales bacterium]|nr:hypothetical protein [Pirellulales bacterium]